MNVQPERRRRPEPELPFVSRLAALASLDAAEVVELRRLAHRADKHLPGEVLLAEGAASRRARFMLSGWACRQRMLPDGRRQILSFVLPGDGIAAAPYAGPLVLAETVALTRVETVDAQRLVEAASRQTVPGVARALQEAQALDEGLVLDHVVRLGRQTAYERMAHLLLEFAHRLSLVGLGSGCGFKMPISQEILADALGISVVHVNRTLGQLRRDRLIDMAAGEVTLLQPEALALTADYKAPRSSRSRPDGII